jgi:hypothetical protein
MFLNRSDPPALDGMLRAHLNLTPKRPANICTRTPLLPLGTASGCSGPPVVIFSRYISRDVDVLLINPCTIFVSYTSHCCLLSVSEDDVVNWPQDTCDDYVGFSDHLIPILRDTHRPFRLQRSPVSPIPALWLIYSLALLLVSDGCRQMMAWGMPSAVWSRDYCLSQPRILPGPASTSEHTVPPTRQPGRHVQANEGMGTCLRYGLCKLTGVLQAFTQQRLRAFLTD